MRTNVPVLVLLAAVGCNAPLLSRDRDTGADAEPETPAPLPEPQSSAASQYDELRLALDAKRSRLAMGIDQMSTAPGSVYFTRGSATVYRARGGSVTSTGIETEHGLAASDAVVVVGKGSGFSAHGANAGEPLGAIGVEKRSKFSQPFVDGASIYLHGLHGPGPQSVRAVYAWQPGAEPTLHALLPNTGVIPIGEGTWTLDGNLERIGVSGGSVYVLLFSPGVVYGQRTDGSPLRVTHVGSTILSAAFYPDGALVGSLDALPELVHVRSDTGEVTKLHEVLAKAGAPEGVPSELAPVKEYAAAGERVGPYLVYVGGSRHLGTEKIVTGVFAFDERSGRVIPVALAPLGTDGYECFASVHVTTDGGIYITSSVDGGNALSYVDGRELLAD